VLPVAHAVAPFTTHLEADVLVTATRSLTPADVQRIVGISKASHSELIDTAHVHLGPGTTDAIGVDPSTFRDYTPAGTAESTPLWQSVADGDLAVAHAVGKALAVPLGGTTTIGVSLVRSERVGAYATTGLPGVGVVVDHSESAQLGLLTDSGLIVSAPGQDSVVVAAVLAHALGAGYVVSPLRVPQQNGHLTWVAPAFGPISSPYGNRPDPNHRGQTEFHAGVDIAAPLGNPIYAVSAGVVQYAGPASGFGQEIILEHAGGVTTVYGHMSAILVTHGSVTAGQPIALVGAEGDATGPHLHFEVHVNDQTVDPLAWLAAHGVKVNR
jgi:murein DD-endopeptidase MepM/ murein hydrolase activator NlpD